MIRYLTIALCLFFVGAALAFDEPKDFRGIPWGTSSQEAEQIIRQQWKARRDGGELILDTDISTRHSDERLKWFSVRDKIGSVPVDLSFEFLDNEFVYARVLFKSKEFGIIESAFKEKYGSPTSERLMPGQTGFGVRYENKELKWDSPTMRIWVRKFGDKITDGFAYMGKLKYLEYLAEKNKKKKADAAKDL